MNNKVINRIFYRLDLYLNDLEKLKVFEEKNIPEFLFHIINDKSDLSKLQLIIKERGEKYGNSIKERLDSDLFFCFCFIEKVTGRVAYVRWLRKGSFYHDRYKKIIQLSDDEAFTMDSYTCYEFRGKGLHKEMNKRILNYCKLVLKLKYIYLVIFNGSEYDHLHKIVKDIGYMRIDSNTYFNSSFLKSIFYKLTKFNA